VHNDRSWCDGALTTRSNMPGCWALAVRELFVSLPRIVALVSDGHRVAVAQLLAQRVTMRHGAMVFATDGADAARSVTSESFLLIDASRLGELGAIGRGMVGESPSGPRLDLGNEVEAWLQRLPARTQGTLREALAAPRSWSVKRLAHNAGVSTRQLVRQYHAAGCPVQPKDLLIAARLLFAQTLLRGARRPTARELGQACGWVDARSLRAALRRAALPSIAALAHLAQCRASLSDLLVRIQRSRA